MTNFQKKFSTQIRETIGGIPTPEKLSIRGKRFLVWLCLDKPWERDPDEPMNKPTISHNETIHEVPAEVMPSERDLDAIRKIRPIVACAVEENSYVFGDDPLGVGESFRGRTAETDECRNYICLNKNLCQFYLGNVVKYLVENTKDPEFIEAVKWYKDWNQIGWGE